MMVFRTVILTNELSVPLVFIQFEQNSNDESPTALFSVIPVVCKSLAFI